MENKTKYIVKEEDIIQVGNSLILTNKEIVVAIEYANEALISLYKNTKNFDINIFEVLGMRNLSCLVGEYFAKSLVKCSKGKLQSNLHQDGYPDLVLTNTTALKNYYSKLYTVKNGKKHPISKELFCPYKYGGIEIKATCGNIPSNGPKLIVGEQRIDYITKIDWKAHHRETNNLIGIFWDFIKDIPTIVFAFYSNTLTKDHWGKIVTPKESGGRTTSVSIMNAKGIKNMYNGCIAVLNLPKYTNFIKKKKEK